MYGSIERGMKNVPTSRRKRIGVILIVLGLALVTAAANILSLGDYRAPLPAHFLAARRAAIVIGLAVLCALSWRHLIQFPRKLQPIQVLWGAFGLSILMSGFWHADISALLQGVWFLFGVPLVFFWAIPGAAGISASSVLAWAIIIGTIPYIIISLGIQPLVFPYEGIFGNPNQFGVAAVSLFAVVAARVALGVRMRPWKLITYSCGLAVLTLLVLASGSRTSLLALLVVASVMVYWWMRQWRSNGAVKSVLLVSVIALPIAVVVGVNAGSFHNMLEMLMLKHDQRLDSGLMGPRGFIWFETLMESRVLGHGSHYFADNYVFGAHNSVVEVMGVYGWVAASILVMVALCSVYMSYRYAVSGASDNAWRLLPLMVVLAFWVLSMGEALFGALGRGITIAMYFAIGVVINKRRN